MTGPYPLTLNVWHAGSTYPDPTTPVGAPSLSGIPAFLQQAHTTFQYSATTILPPPFRYIYTPPGTDVRLDLTYAKVDIVELPAGSKVYYAIVDVQDLQKGTALAERRLVAIPLSFPAPIP